MNTKPSIFEKYLEENIDSIGSIVAYIRNSEYTNIDIYSDEKIASIKRSFVYSRDFFSIEEIKKIISKLFYGTEPTIEFSDFNPLVIGKYIPKNKKYTIIKNSLEPTYGIGIVYHGTIDIEDENQHCLRIPFFEKNFQFFKNIGLSDNEIDYLNTIILCKFFNYNKTKKWNKSGFKKVIRKSYNKLTDSQKLKIEFEYGDINF